MKYGKSKIKYSILNNPYEELCLHYATNEAVKLDYKKEIGGCRTFIPDISPVPVRQDGQKSLMDVGDISGQLDIHFINRARVVSQFGEESTKVINIG